MLRVHYGVCWINEQGGKCTLYFFLYSVCRLKDTRKEETKSKKERQTDDTRIDGSCSDTFSWSQFSLHKKRQCVPIDPRDSSQPSLDCFWNLSNMTESILLCWICLTEIEQLCSENGLKLYWHRLHGCAWMYYQCCSSSCLMASMSMMMMVVRTVMIAMICIQRWQIPSFLNVNPIWTWQALLSFHLLPSKKHDGTQKWNLFHRRIWRNSNVFKVELQV